MIQRGRGTCFPCESLAEPLGRNLDRDFAPQPRVARAVDFAHATGADGRKNLIGAQTSPNRQAHTSWNDSIPARIAAQRIGNDGLGMTDALTGKVDFSTSCGLRPT